MTKLPNIFQRMKLKLNFIIGAYLNFVSCNLIVFIQVRLNFL